MTTLACTCCGNPTALPSHPLLLCAACWYGHCTTCTTKAVEPKPKPKPEPTDHHSELDEEDR